MFDFEISGIHLEEKLVRGSIIYIVSSAVLVLAVTLHYTSHMLQLVSFIMLISIQSFN